MRKSNNIRNSKCEHIEDLLIKQNLEELRENEKNLVQEHLTTCINCRNYQQQLADIQNTMTVSQKSPLTPTPSIRQTLFNQMKNKKLKKHSALKAPWQWLLEILEYRIPVYQGLICFACILLIFIASNYFSFSNQHDSVTSQYNKMTIDTTFYQINVIKNLQIIEQQKIGKNVSEDTLLTRFIVSSM